MFVWGKLVGELNDNIVAGADDLTGLCIFNWFIVGAGPEFFDLPDNKLSKSILMGPAFFHVEPRGTNGCDFDVLLSVLALLIVWGCRRLLDGFKMLSAKRGKNRNTNEIGYQ